MRNKCKNSDKGEINRILLQIDEKEEKFRFSIDFRICSGYDVGNYF